MSRNCTKRLKLQFYEPKYVIQIIYDLKFIIRFNKMVANFIET